MGIAWDDDPSKLYEDRSTFFRVIKERVMLTHEYFLKTSFLDS